jgi:hypothetical protein
MGRWGRGIAPSLRLLLLSLLLCGAVVTLVHAASGQGGFAAYGFDFHGGIWHAGRDILAGHSPYRAPDAKQLARVGNAYIPPPLLAELLVPLSTLPFWLAVVLLNALCIGSLVIALRLLGVHSRQVFLLCLCCAPFVFALRYGDPDAVYVLLAAIAWRYRDRPRGACAVGVLIAAKLVLWPMVIWLVATRRLREAAISAGSAAALLIASWALIDFRGLLQYPRFLAADAQVQSTNHSLLALLRRLGASGSPAEVLAVALAVGVGLLVVRAGRGRDHAWFAGALITGLLASAVAFPNYFVILVVPLAIARRGATGAWFLLAVFSVQLHGAPELVLELLLASAIALITARASSDRASPRALPTVQPAAP